MGSIVYTKEKFVELFRILGKDGYHEYFGSGFFK